ncbi:phosphate acyltransferase PlsX, partial [Alphaproteobacteria bacterium]|nr:phosphate acyltransferase PlsX [Alphaproteobacteria bacterium]
MATFTISVDLMGGDDAPKTVVEGLVLCRKQYPHIHFLLYGTEEIVAPYRHHFDDGMTFIPTTEVITADAKPSAAVRGSKNSSMRLAIEAVKEGKAQGVVSAGNTGAYMALSKMILKTIEGIDRPAIMAVMPTCKEDAIVLDLGANVECSVENLVQFAMMGDAYARYVLERPNPSVGLLNIGSEDLKGKVTVKEASRILSENGVLQNFYGFVEGDDVGRGTTDVVVTDGFTGNVMLKAIEGAASLIKT